MEQGAHRARGVQRKGVVEGRCRAWGTGTGEREHRARRIQGRDTVHGGV